MKILPTMSSGVVLLHEDGSFEIAPLQVFLTATGGTCIRLGRNVLFFDAKGHYDGSECKLEGTDAVTNRTAADAIMAAYEASHENKGRPPATAYFPAGSPGWARETAAWPESALRITVRTAKDEVH